MCPITLGSCGKVQIADFGYHYPLFSNKLLCNGSYSIIERCKLSCLKVYPENATRAGLTGHTIKQTEMQLTAQDGAKAPRGNSPTDLLLDQIACKTCV
jgi:hypothetical protein